MVDDQQAQPVQDPQVTSPSPSDQTPYPPIDSPPPDVSSDTQRPISSDLADQNMADGTVITQPAEATQSAEIQQPESSVLADETVATPSQTVPSPIQKQTPPDIGQSASQIVADEGTSASADQRPISSEVADEKLADEIHSPPQEPEVQKLADETIPVDSSQPPPYSEETISPVPSAVEGTTSAQSQQISADSTVSPADSNLTTEAKEEVEKPVESQPSDQQSTPISAIPDLNSLSDSSNLSNPSVVDSIPEEKPSESPPPQDNINVPSSNQQAPQVQPEAPKDTSSIDTSKQDIPSASFSPEPLQPFENTPLADKNVMDSGQKSFGDLLSSENQTPVNPSIPSISPIPSAPSPPLIPSTPSAPSIPFGDLIKDIEITSPSIPEAERPVEQQQAAPPSQPQSQTSPPISPSTPQSTLSPILPSSSPLSQSDLSAEALAKADQLAQIRLTAQKIKAQKISKNFEKILELAKSNQYIVNQDVRELLHISQSAVTNYLSQLVKSGKLTREGKSKYIRYHL